MKQSKRQKALYIRVAPEFLELLNILIADGYGDLSQADILSDALAGYALRSYIGKRQSRIIALAAAIGEIRNKTAIEKFNRYLQRKKRREQKNK